jgi:uncharacterized protein
MYLFQNKDQLFEFDPQDFSIKSQVDLIHRPIGEPSRGANSEVRVNSISINIAQRCNLNCTYCYADGGTYGNSGDIDLQTAKQTIEWLVAQSPDTRVFGINFFGGEPLLRFTTVKDVVAYTSEFAARKDIRFSYSITTNGTLLNDEIIAFFQTHDFAVNVSVDGPRELHDKQRPFINGKGSYDVLVPKLKLLLATGLHVSVRSTVTDQTPEDDVTQSLKAIGFHHITVTRASGSLFGNVRPVESADGLVQLQTRKEEVQRLNWQSLQDEADHFLEMIASRDIEGIRDTRLSPKLYKNIFSLLTGKKRETFCGAGKNYAGISSSGEVYLCHRFVGTEAYRIGHVNDEKSRTIDELKAERPSGLSKCESCFAKNLCGGGCYHDNLGKTGSIFEQHEDDCINVRSIAEIAIAMVARLSAGDKQFLAENNVIFTKFCPLDL